MGKGVCGPLPYPPSPPRPEIVELREFPDFFVELSAGVFFSISDLRMSWKRHFWSISEAFLDLKSKFFACGGPIILVLTQIDFNFFNQLVHDSLIPRFSFCWSSSSVTKLRGISARHSKTERTSETSRYRIPLYSWILVLCQKAGKHCMRLEQLCIAGKALFHK